MQPECKKKKKENFAIQTDNASGYEKKPNDAVDGAGYEAEDEERNYEQELWIEEELRDEYVTEEETETATDTNEETNEANWNSQSIVKTKLCEI